MTGRAALDVLVLGAGGQLGGDLRRTLAARGAATSWTALDHTEVDVGDPAAVEAAVVAWSRRAEALGTGRRAVVNAAAWTDVDAAESREDAAFRVNAAAAGHVAAACARVDAVLVHVSTDYVFAGDAAAPYDEDAPTAPLNAYGRSKLAGERAVRASLPAAYVVRTAWLYGADGRNFVKTMARLERERGTVTVVDDQRGAPTWSAHLAGALVDLTASGAPYGTYHCTSAGETTWYGLARAVFEELGADPARVRPAASDGAGRPARRPAYAVLSNRRWRGTGLPPLPHWRDALREAYAVAGDALRRG